MKKMRIGVLTGGVDHERDFSEKTAQHILQTLDPSRFMIVTVKLSPNMQLTVGGEAQDPDTLFRTLDIVIIAAHGAYVEDGQLQQLLDSHSVRYLGSDALSSSVGFSKILTKKAALAAGIQTPAYVSVTSEECKDNKKLIKNVQSIFNTVPQPCVVKPAKTGSSIGVTFCETRDDIYHALQHAAQFSDKVIAEEYITGCEVTVGVIENFRDQDVYTLPAVEIQSENYIFSYTEKKDRSVKEICPAVLDDKVRDSLATESAKIFKTLHLSDYARADFIIHPKRGAFLLEINTLPDLSEDSLFNKALLAVGVGFNNFLIELLERK